MALVWFSLHLWSALKISAFLVIKCNKINPNEVLRVHLHTTSMCRNYLNLPPSTIDSMLVTLTNMNFLIAWCKKTQSQERLRNCALANMAQITQLALWLPRLWMKPWGAFMSERLKAVLFTVMNTLRLPLWCLQRADVKHLSLETDIFHELAGDECTHQGFAQGHWHVEELGIKPCDQQTTWFSICPSQSRMSVISTSKRGCLCSLPLLEGGGAGAGRFTPSFLFQL